MLKIRNTLLIILLCVSKMYYASASYVPLVFSNGTTAVSGVNYIEVNGDITYTDLGNGEILLNVNSSPNGTVMSVSSIADNALVRGDGGATGIQGSGILVDDNNNISNVNNLNVLNYSLLNNVDAINLFSQNTFINGTLTLPTGSSTGLVLTSDANGLATWQAIPSSADDLGSHIAGTNLNLNGFSLINAQDVNGVTANFTNGNFTNITTSTIFSQDSTFNGNISIPTGSATGFVLTSDANGLATWQAIPSSADDLGSHIAGTNLNLNGFSLINAQDVNGITAIFTNGNFANIITNTLFSQDSIFNGNISIPTGSATGFVLTSDANGLATWQAIAGVSNGAISNATILSSNFQDSTFNGSNFFTNNSTLQVNGNIIIPSGATTGFVLTTDANGLATWQAIPSSADNLGSHIAGTNLNLNGFSLINAQDVNGITAIFTNGNFANITTNTLFSQDSIFNGNISIPTGSATGFVLTSDANGLATWQAIAGVSNGAISNATILSSNFQDSTFNGLNFFTNNSILQVNGNISLPTGSATGFVLTSDANGLATWQAIPSSADDLGSHIAGTNLNLNGFSLINAQDVNGDTANFANGNFTNISTKILSVNGNLFIPYGSNAGFVLTSDINGNASWTDLSSLSTNGDNLGNHIATANINLNGNNLINVQQIDINGSLIYQNGASTGFVLTSDANGLATWQAIAGVSNGTISNATILSSNFQDSIFNGTNFFTNNSSLQVNGNILIPNGANTGFVLTTDANGLATWQAPALNASGANGAIQFALNGTLSSDENNFFYDHLNGNLGIGTNNPNYALEIDKDNPTIYLNNNGGTSNDHPIIRWNSNSDALGLRFYSGATEVARAQDNRNFQAGSFSTFGAMNMREFFIQRGNSDGAITMPGSGVVTIGRGIISGASIAASEYARFDSGGNLGLLTTTPSALLDVGGGIRNFTDGIDDALIADDLEVDGNLYLNGTLATSLTPRSVIFAGANGTLSENNNSFVWDNTNRRLSIGKANPLYALDMNGHLQITPSTGPGLRTSANLNTFNIESTGGVGATNLRIGSSNNSSTSVYAHNGPIYLEPGPYNGAARYQFNDSGLFVRSYNILEGDTNSPTYYMKEGLDNGSPGITRSNLLFGTYYQDSERPAIQVRTIDANNSFIGFSNNDNFIPSAKVHIQNGNLFVTNGNIVTEGITIPTGAANGLVLVSDANGVASWQIPPTVTASGVNGAIQFSEDGVLSSNGNEFYWDINNGRLGIGTNLVSSALEVDTGTRSFSVVHGGKIAINTESANPNSGEISFGNNENQVFGSTASGAGTVGFYWTDRQPDSATSIGGSYYATNLATSGAKIFQWNAAAGEKAYIDVTGGAYFNGNTAIGYQTNTIPSKLAVNGDLFIRNGSTLNGTTLFTNNSVAQFNGGINIPNGAVQDYVLTSDANGNANWRDISYVLTNGGAFLGALNDAISDRNSNLFLGNGAGLVHTGQNNTGVGINALRNVTAGNGNTVLGFSAFTSLNSGSNNIALGDRAGNGMVSGDNNIFIGTTATGTFNGTSNELNIGDRIFGDLANGFVAINDNNPLYELQVNGTTFTKGLIMPTGAANGLVLVSDANGVASWQIPPTVTASGTNGAIQFSEDGVLSSNGNEFYWDINNGRLGIGTNIPTQDIEVNGNIIVTNGVFGTNYIGAGDGIHGALSNRRLSLDDGTFVDPNGNGFGSQGWSFEAAGGGYEFTANSISRMLITNSGRIGVNNINPNAMIAMNISNGTEQGLTLRAFNNQTANLLELKDNGGTTITTFDNGGFLGIGFNDPIYNLAVNGTTYTEALIIPTGAANGLVLVSDANGVASWQIPPTVTASGVNGAIQFSEDGVLSSNGNTFYWDINNGRLGIGTNIPSATLQVNGAINLGNFDNTIYSSTSNDIAVTSAHLHAQYGLWARDAVSRSMGIDGNTNSMDLYTAGTPKMNINSTGNVGIGFSSSAAKLSINGDLLVQNGSTLNGTTLFTNNSIAQFNGGINIPSGAVQDYVLTSDANGNANWRDISYVLTNGGAFLGALNDAISDRNSNLFLGNGAGLVHTGQNNTGVGINALRNVTAGNGNTVLGFSAFTSLNSGSNNIALGDRAGNGMVSGDNNIFIGTTATGTFNGTSNELNIGDRIFGDLANGFIAINDNNPLYELQVNGTTFTKGFIMPTGAANGLVLVSDANGVATWQIPPTVTASGTNGAIQFSEDGVLSSNGSRFYWDDNNGRLGIGNNNPQYTLEVGSQTTTAYPARIRINDNSDNQQLIFSNGNQNRFMVRNSGTVLGFLSQSTGAAGVGQSFLFTGGTPDTGHLGSLFRITGNYNNAGQRIDGLDVNITNTSSAANSSLANFKTNGNSKLFVDVSGNVGINNTTPNSMLAINLINSTEQGLTLRAFNGQTANLTEWTANDSSRRISIGSLANNDMIRLYSNNNAHRTTLHAMGDNNSQMIEGTYDGNQTFLINYDPSLGTNTGNIIRYGTRAGSIFQPGYEARLHFRPRGLATNTMTLDENGNVGIGKIANPNIKLDVNGALAIRDGSQANGFVLTSDANGVASWQAPSATSSTASGANGSLQFAINGSLASDPTNLHWNNSSNRLGIGTNTPSTTLEINGALSFASEVNNGVSGAGITINFSSSNKQRVTLNANTTLTLNAPGVGNYLLKVVQDATGSRTATWAAASGAIRWPSGIAPTLSSTANAVDIVSCYYDGTDYFCLANLNFI